VEPPTSEKVAWQELYPFLSKQKFGLFPIILRATNMNISAWNREQNFLSASPGWSHTCYIHFHTIFAQ
jgi:hypothetical protein